MSTKTIIELNGLICLVISALFWLFAEYLSMLTKKADKRSIEKKTIQENIQLVRFQKFFLKVRNSPSQQIVYLALVTVLKLKNRLFKKITKALAVHKPDKELSALSILFFSVTLMASVLFFIVLIDYPSCTVIWKWRLCYPVGDAKAYAIETFAYANLLFIISFSLTKQRFEQSIGVILWDFFIVLVPIQGLFIILAIIVALLAFSLKLGLWLSGIPILLLVYYGPHVMTSLIATMGAGYPDKDSDIFRSEKLEAEAEFQRIIDESGTNIFAFFFGFFFGLFLSWLAIIVGQVIQPTYVIPLTAPILLINSVADGITLTVTIIIIKKMIRAGSVYKSVGYILLNILIASILAIAAMYLGSGFEGTDSVSLVDAFFLLAPYKLVNHSAMNQFGSYFFLTNSTLLPVFIYLIIVVLCYLFKLCFYRPLRYIATDLNENKQPVEYLAAMFKVAARLFAIPGAIAVVFKLLLSK